MIGQARYTRQETRSTRLANLVQLFETEGVMEVRYQFQLFCQAAVSPTYSWSLGSPGNLLFITKQLELLIDACHEYAVASANLNIASPNSLALTRIDAFFDYQSLSGWKKDLLDWQEAGLSDFSITDEADAGKLVLFCLHINALIDVAQLLAESSN